MMAKEVTQEGSFTSRNVIDDSRNLEFAAGNLEL